MTSANENGSDKRGAGRTSGATRRIVVQNLPPEEVPQARGRKLATPVDGRTSATGSVSGNQRTAGNENAAGLKRLSVTQNTGPQFTADFDRTAHRPGSRTSAKKRTNKQSVSGPNHVNVRKLLLIIGGMLAFAFVVTGALLLLGSTGKKKNRAPETSPSVADTSTTSRQVEGSTTPASSPESTDTNILQSTTEIPAEASGPTLVEAREVSSLSEQLAAQISQKGGYSFAPEFVELIRARTRDYSSQKALEGARHYRREINKSFRDEGLNPVVGYVIAMSRSKFNPNTVEKGLGIWQIPPAVARSQGYLSAGENTSRLKAPEASAQISAAYTKALLSTFDAEDFMYAIACFGMNLQEAGRVQARLVAVVPDAKNRREVMKAIRAGVLTADQIDAIACFFAAGIVGENPQKFGLHDSPPFSSLY